MCGPPTNIHRSPFTHLPVQLSQATTPHHFTTHTSVTPLRVYQAKVDVVREAMQDSLQVLLQNDAKLQNLEKASEALTEQAKVCRVWVMFVDRGVDTVD